MVFDLNRSYFNDLKERKLVIGTVITDEGMLLSYASDSEGGMACQLATDGANERIAGWAITDEVKASTEPVVETFVVPAGGGAVNLRSTSIIPTSIRATRDVALTVMAASVGAPAAGEYQLSDAAKGIVVFNVAQAGATVHISYRYNLTVAQVIGKYHQRSINSGAQDVLSQISIGCLEGEIFTTCFDSSVLWALSDIVRASALPGLVTNAGAGKIVGHVSQTPSLGDGYLGVKYSIPAS